MFIRDESGRNVVNFEPTGTLYVKRDPDQPYIPDFAKAGDVGLDIPVKINIDKVKFGLGEPDRLRRPLLYPDLKHYIYPDGFPGDVSKRPCLEVPALGWAEIPSGISIKLPNNAWGYMKSRSSTAWKLHLVVIHATIDPGYVGQLGTLVYNPNFHPVRVYEYDSATKTGDRLAQLILIPVYDLQAIVLTDTLPDTVRGKTGFGSTTLSSESTRGTKVT